MNTGIRDLLAPDRLGPALADALGDPAWTTFNAQLITGGKSNLTFRLTSSAGSVVLRRPPTGALVATAHDMSRETRVQVALAETAVPVPDILIADDGDLIGVPCYVMGDVRGHVVRDRLPVVLDGPDTRRRVGTTLIDTLAAIHRVPFAKVGLAGHGRPEGFLTRQLRRWSGQLGDGSAHPVTLHRLALELGKRVPAGGEAALLHGDYRLDNVVLADDGTGAAVLDWEMSTLGDPLTDLALLLLYWREPGDRPLGLTPDVTHLPGFHTRAELVSRYAAITGTDVGELRWYEAFAHFKFAMIAAGIANRVAAGAMAGQDFGDLTADIAYLAEAGLERVSP
ncbi:phosphotransferase family protein [Klenkia brasiliensis]|uniref:Predicted kinase, aminoglycoside phosphotransferase (APT) family n=1 Tax=Klenkia brasiliensis TaxID=333142 RepID=A0A1G7Z4F3_9ACTN|nr:phosphotransferase family protein [Klenkia brasiliensis]SDH03517.1 Predicted kinase, aminoglycoside phosphotransferase (APT) family [Klenkia brasiliensis]